MTRLPDYAVLEEVGLTLYERKALIALMVFGVADAAALCREGGVPTSKIYLAMEKLAGLGLAQIQPTRPKLFASLPPDTVADRVVEIARERAERFATRAPDLRELLTSLPGRVRGSCDRVAHLCECGCEAWRRSRPAAPSGYS